MYRTETSHKNVGLKIVSHVLSEYQLFCIQDLRLVLSAEAQFLPMKQEMRLFFSFTPNVTSWTNRKENRFWIVHVRVHVDILLRPG